MEFFIFLFIYFSYLFFFFFFIRGACQYGGKDFQDTYVFCTVCTYFCLDLCHNICLFIASFYLPQEKMRWLDTKIPKHPHPALGR